jgi:nucleotide-binding universal stress UspA family protein
LELEGIEKGWCIPMFCSKILLAYDGSNQAKKALEKAVELAGANVSIEINLVYVVKVVNSVGTTYANIPDPWSEFDVQHGHSIIEQAMDILDANANKCEAFVLEGLPEEEIITFAQKYNCDLIIMGSRGLSGLKELLMGSVSHHVTQNSSVPVLIVK